MPDRQRMAAAQARLLDSLLGDGPSPPGFNPDDVDFAGRMLRDKRARVDAKRAQAKATAATETKPSPRGWLRRLLRR